MSILSPKAYQYSKISGQSLFRAVSLMGDFTYIQLRFPASGLTNFYPVSQEISNSNEI